MTRSRLVSIAAVVAASDTAASVAEQIVQTMHALENALIQAGLVGSGWQVAPRAMVSTANLLRSGDHDTIIDLESGIPAVLVPRYLLSGATRASLPPFDDLDADRLRSWFDANERWLAAEACALACGTVRREPGRLAGCICLRKLSRCKCLAFELGRKVDHPKPLGEVSLEHRVRGRVRAIDRDPWQASDPLGQMARSASQPLHPRRADCSGGASDQQARQSRLSTILTRGVHRRQ